MGLVNPHNSRDKRADVGVENGPEAVLTNSFLKKFPINCVGKYVFPKPKKTGHRQFNKILGKQIEEFKKFYEAESYNQEYYEYNKNNSYCSIVIDPKIQKLLNEFSDDVKEEYKN